MTTPTADTPEPTAETDSRFPSGEWTGFWRQSPNEKGRMDLHLTFVGGRVSGEGRDLVGEFVMTGRYTADSGKVVVLKRYLSAHDIQYEGWAEEGKGIWGVWSIDGARDKGGFHVWPKCLPDPSGTRLREAVELSKEEAEELLLTA